MTEGRVLQDGAGRKSDPYRYWLPGMEEKWRANPSYLDELPSLELLRGGDDPEDLLERWMRERKRGGKG